MTGSSLEADSNAQRVTEIRASSLGGRTLLVRSRQVVLCVGGIESARLLLLSDSVEKSGIGNRHDNVGRFFQDHPHVHASLKRFDPQRFRRYCDSFRRDAIRVSPKMVAAPELQVKEQITNVGAEVYYPASDDDDSLTAAKTFLRAARSSRERHLLLPSAARMMRDPAKVVSAAFRYYVRKQPASVGSTNPRVGFFCEQEPNRDSRVTLCGEKDALGMRRTTLDWRLSSSVTRAVEILARTINQEWARLNIGEITESMFGVDPGRFVDINHHIGTARMGTNPAQSVVDGDCRVHGYENLYIGSSATFPTGGFSNPTLTVLALTVRIADRIKKQIGNASESLVSEHA
jgi:choline dehydrogenase-like flavoprotein